MIYEEYAFIYEQDPNWRHDRLICVNLETGEAAIVLDPYEKFVVVANELERSPKWIRDVFSLLFA